MLKPTPAFTLPCAICGEPVDLRTCKTDADGKAVHSECFDSLLFKRKPPSGELQAQKQIADAMCYAASELHEIAKTLDQINLKLSQINAKARWTG
jgi:hypothetical protein